MAKELIQNHYKNQKHIKQVEKTYISKHYNEMPQKFGCHDFSTSYSYKKKL